MELNPHIPKPDPPKEEEKKEEEKKDNKEEEKKEEEKEKVTEMNSLLINQEWVDDLMIKQKYVLILR